MIEKPVICFQNVGKRFKLAHASKEGALASLLNQVKRPAGNRDDDVLWAVRNVSFDVARGESVGLIGHNGSGKSTLLKLATRILTPTDGQINVDGRISPLLELGAGFHTDLTGRENIYLNGSVLGLSNPEIDERLEAIIDFSELEQFIDVPVKHYSSGMYMRLGFSVAVHCDPDVLLVDEILAVGDRAFQKKCLDRIVELKNGGVTIIMVSHSLDTLLKLCDKVVWMDQGELKEIGAPQATISRYVEFMNSRIAQQSGGKFIFNRHGTREAEITGVRFLDANGDVQNSFAMGTSMTIEMQYVAHQPIEDPEFGIAIYRHDGTQVTGPNNRIAHNYFEIIEGAGTVHCRIDNMPLMPGAYTLSVAIHSSTLPMAYDFHAHAYSFSVRSDERSDLEGIFMLSAEWVQFSAEDPIHSSGV